MAPLLELQVLLLQIRRASWRPSGRQVKDCSRVAFSEFLDPTALTETSAPLPRPAPLPSRAPSRAVHSVPACPSSVAQHQSHVTLQECSLDPQSDAQQAPVAEGCPPQQTSPAAETPLPAIAPVYQLCAVVVHHGDTSSGHYSTYRAVRCAVARAKCQWFKVSDACVSRCDVQEVLRTEATMLVYEYLDGTYFAVPGIQQ